MIKKKAKAKAKKSAKKSEKTAEKKAAKGKIRGKSKKDKNPAEVREEISKLVRGEATELAQAVMGEGKKGELAPVRYLFEMANIFPAPPKGEEATEEEDCLAKMLLDKLNAPKKPATEDVEEEGEEDCAVKAEDAEVGGAAAENGNQNPHPTKTA